MHTSVLHVILGVNTPRTLCFFKGRRKHGGGSDKMLAALLWVSETCPNTLERLLKLIMMSAEKFKDE